MNELQNFISKSFGQVRGCIIDDIPYLVGKDVVSILGYSNILDKYNIIILIKISIN